MVCLVTGSTSGIGESIARTFLDHGASVLVTGLPGSLGWDLDAYGPRAHIEYSDLSDAEAPQFLIDAVLRRFGKLDVLVNNAATMERSDYASTSVEVFDRIMAVNARAPLLLCKLAFPSLALSHGCILNIGSSNGYCGACANLLAYSMSKGALHTMSRNLADAWASSGVRVNHFVVGWVLSTNEYDRKCAEGMAENWHLAPPRYSAPFGALTEPSTIAAAALYWCSRDSWPLSGNTIELEQFPLIGRKPPKRE